ncbi:MAG: hypothetical protein QOH66_2160 [Actinomycetota bacterium]|nr:hypothetical protein [Actinomycetota bacterium]
MAGTPEERVVGVNRRQFLLRTGTLGAAATVFLYPTVARAAGVLDPAIEDIAAPALKILARDTISGLVAFQVPGSDKYSVAQGVTSNRPGGIDARGEDVFLIDLDEFLPLPETYVHALAACFTTAVSDIPIPAELLGPLAQLGEKFGTTMDDALRALTESDAAVPLSLLIALMLNFLATQVDPASVAGSIPTSPFASLSFDDKARAFDALENADSNLVATLDRGAPEPLKGSLSGLLKFVGGALLEFGAYLSYGEWGVFDPATKTVSQRPVGWDLSNYMPGRTTPADGWDEFKGYFQGRQSTATDPAVLAAIPVAGAQGGSGGVGGGEVARSPRKRRKHRKKHHRKGK